MRVLMLSGGLDSALILFSEGSAIDLCLSVDYGQPNRNETHAARELARIRGVKHETVRCMYDFSPRSGLMGGNDATAEDSVIPGRNVMLMSLAAIRGASVVVFGCNADDQDAYEDCRPEMLNGAALACGVSVDLPLIDLTKREIATAARCYCVPIESTISCYRGTRCCKCAACIARREAIQGSANDRAGVTSEK